MSLLVIAAILSVSAGCERTDYEGVILKQKMRELEERVIELEDQVDEGTVRGPGEATEAAAKREAEEAVVVKGPQTTGGRQKSDDGKTSRGSSTPARGSMSPRRGSLNETRGSKSPTRRGN